MTTALPTIYPVGYSGTIKDFLQTKLSREGDGKIQTGTVAVPATTATSTLIGLIPFNKGAKISMAGSSVYSDALGAASLNIGYTYYDSTTGTTNASGFVAGTTISNAGGYTPFLCTSSASAGMTWTAAADGWIACTNTAATTTTGNILFNLAFAYDASGVTNP